jgi:predicted enzyme related to lactoylglutathione lyase
MNFRMAGVVLRCRDVASLARFYEEVVGFQRWTPAPGEPVGNQVRYRFEPGAIIELLAPGGDPAADISRREDAPSTPMLRVDDIQPLYDRLVAHDVRIVTHPQIVEGSTARMVTFLDPENHHICVFQM